MPGLVVMALDRHSVFQGQHRSRRTVPERPPEAAANFLRRRERSCPCSCWFSEVYAALVPTLITAGLILLAAQSSSQSPSKFRRYLAGGRFLTGL